MAQMFISPLVIRAFRTLDGLESFDLNENVAWWVLNEETGARLAGPYLTYENARSAYRDVHKQHG